MSVGTEAVFYGSKSRPVKYQAEKLGFPLCSSVPAVVKHLTPVAWETLLRSR
jgi:hypothetical protein